MLLTGLRVIPRRDTRSVVNVVPVARVKPHPVHGNPIRTHSDLVLCRVDELVALAELCVCVCGGGGVCVCGGGGG